MNEQQRRQALAELVRLLEESRRERLAKQEDDKKTKPKEKPDG